MMTRTALLAVVAATALFAGPAGAVICSDVTFRGNAADYCYGPVAGNIAAADLNGTWASSYPWFLLDKSDGSSQTVFGTTWTVTSSHGTPQGTGTWLLTWANAGGLPLTMDLAVAIKAGPESGAWRFDTEHFLVDPLSGGGSYAITWTVGRNNNNPELSHISVFGRNGRACSPDDCPDFDVPEPGTLGLLGLGLAGLGFGLRRRRRN